MRAGAGPSQQDGRQLRRDAGAVVPQVAGRKAQQDDPVVPLGHHHVVGPQGVLVPGADRPVVLVRRRRTGTRRGPRRRGLPKPTGARSPRPSGSPPPRAARAAIDRCRTATATGPRSSRACGPAHGRARRPAAPRRHATSSGGGQARWTACLQRRHGGGSRPLLEPFCGHAPRAVRPPPPPRRPPHAPPARSSADPQQPGAGDPPKILRAGWMDGGAEPRLSPPGRARRTAAAKPAPSTATRLEPSTATGRPGTARTSGAVRGWPSPVAHASAAARR